jgi:hypothetical protein
MSATIAFCLIPCWSMLLNTSGMYQGSHGWTSVMCRSSLVVTGFFMLMDCSGGYAV